MNKWVSLYAIGVVLAFTFQCEKVIFNDDDFSVTLDSKCYTEVKTEFVKQQRIKELFPFFPTSEDQIEQNQNKFGGLK